MTATVEQAAFRALADPGRRLILETLAPRAREVADLARGLGVSGALVAHHLDVLQRGGLVLIARRQASVAPEGLAALRRYFDEALTAAAIASPRA